MPLSPESIDIRSTRISASEVAAVLGMHPYVTPHQLWARKTGLKTDEVSADNFHVQRGIHMEPALINWYKERTGATVRYTGRHQRTVVHPTRALLCATPDGLVGSKGTLEAKATWYWGARDWGEQGTDLVPRHVLLQCLWQQAATEREWTDCIGMTPEGDLGIWHVKFNPHLFFEIYERVEAWWEQHVVKNIAPPPDASAGCAEVLLAQYPFAGDKDIVEEDAELDAKAFTLRAAETALKQQESRYKRLVNEYKAALGDHYGAKTPSGKVLWYNVAGRKTVDWKAIANELSPDISDEIVERHTRKGDDYRVFRTYWSKEP